jgi:hypothetical protein
MTGKRLLGTFGVLVVGAALCGARTASATVSMMKQAKGVGVAVTDCQYCHGEKMPKKDASTLNDRGKWLVAEKDKRKAKEVDGAWLKDYVEKKEK